MRLPFTAIALGVAGLVPFAACGLGAVTGDPVLAPRALLALIGYGAIILGFLGGVHWGFALPPGAPAALSPTLPPLPGMGRRLVGGILPSLAGWGAVLLAIYRWDDTALILLIAAFTALMIAEARAHQAGLLPPGYIWLRWGLTAGVLICLVSTAILRVLGGTIAL